MNYTAVVANGDLMEEIDVQGVDRVVVDDDNRYTLYDNANIVLFCAPKDSLIYLKLQ